MCYFSNYTSETFEFYKANSKKKSIQGFSYEEILSGTIKINFEQERGVFQEVQSGVTYSDFIFSNKEEYSFNKNDQFVNVYFSFNDSISFDKRKKYIQYELVKTLAFVHRLPKSKEILNITYPIEAIFNDPTYSVASKEFTDFDKFLLQKLYSENFESEFSEYMYRTYPWRYASLFIDKDMTKLKILMGLALLGVLIFILAFSIFNRQRTGFLNYFLPITVILLSLTELHWIYNHVIEISARDEGFKNILDMLMYVLISSGFVSFLLWFLEKKFINTSGSFTYQLVLKLLLTFICFNIPILIGYLIEETQGAIPIYIPLFFVFITLTLGRGLLIYLNYFSKSLIKLKELELSKLKEMNAKNELKSLHAHINPHFLYNALNSIASLAHEDATKTEEMILSLSDLFRYSINRKGRKMSTIEDEVLMVENYLKIEKIRFDDRLNFTLEVKENLLKREIPMYILQPLIENAVKHGVSKIKENGNILLVIKEKEAHISIEIFDNGPDFPDGLFGGYGLQSIYDLLRLSYGESAMLNWENCPKKKIMILIPSKI